MKIFNSKIFYVISSVIVILIFLIAFLPSFFSTNAGKKILKNHIEKKYNASFNASYLKLRWFGPQDIKDLSFTNNDMSIKAESIHIKIPLLRFIKIKDLTYNTMFNMDAQTDIKNASLSIQNMYISKINAKILQENKLANLNISANIQQEGITGFFSLKSQLKENDMSFDLYCNDIPSKVLNYIVKDKIQVNLNDILGNKFDLTAKTKLTNNNGPIDISLNSPTIKADANLNLKNEMLYLNSDFNSTILLTKDMSNLLLGSINPIFRNAFYANNPIYLKIYKEGFSIPFNDNINVKDIVIEKAVLNAGQITAKNIGSLLSIVGFLSHNISITGNSIDLWLSPLYFKMKDGIIDADRMDFLIDNQIHLCIWGLVDVIREKINMKLGITSQALSKAFGIDGLDENFVIPIPMKGSFNNIKLDTKKASQKIAALIAAKEAKTHIDPFLGGILDVLQKSDKNKNIPPPHRPFPWEGKINLYNDKNKRTQKNIFEFLK